MYPALRSALREMIVPRLHPFVVFRAPETFQLQSIRYRYFRHSHNRTWINERIVEVALGLSMLQRYAGKHVLEVGNVLSNYISITHDVLDKYESSDGVINEDIVTFKPKTKYDLIISISTLEHVGWDEVPRNPDKVINAVFHMRQLLAPKGLIMITTPFGYNPYIDRLILGKKLPVDQTYFLERKSWKNDWLEVHKANLSRMSYSWFFMHANTIAISYIYAS